MRKVALLLIAFGTAIAIAGAALGCAAWTGQEVARAQREQEIAGEQEPHDAQPVMRLSFPTIGKEFFVADGASHQNLLLGPARVEWSSVPGEKGNAIIAGHRDTHFRILKDLQKGEPITVERDGRLYQY